MPLLILILAPLVVLLSLRLQAKSGWEGLKFGDSEKEIVSRLGPPAERIEFQPGAILRYPGMTLGFRSDGLYRVQIDGDPADLYRKGLAYYGIPVDSTDNSTSWVSSNVVARQYGGTLLISCQ